MTRLVKLLFKDDNTMLTDLLVDEIDSSLLTIYDEFIGTVEYTDGSHFDIYRGVDGEIVKNYTRKVKHKKSYSEE